MQSHHTFVANRIPAIDTLRVIAIAVLVIYHHFMVYVPEWGFHYKIDTDWVWLQSLMVVTSPWRMGLLWLISGVALSFMLTKLSASYALIKRTSQLLFPLLIGVLFIVPPQLYIEMSQAGEMPLRYIEFLQALFFAQGDIFKNFTPGIWPAIDVNHLWFLRSLWLYSLVAIVVSPLLKPVVCQKSIHYVAAKLWLILFVVFVCSALIHYNLEGNDVRESYGFVWFATGFIFGRYQNLWQQLSRHAIALSVLAAISLLTIQIGYVLIWKDENASAVARAIVELVYVFNRTIMPIAVVAMVFQWFNKPYPAIKRLNPLVFPLYIVHQSLTVVVTFLLTQYAPSIGLYLHLLMSAVLMLACSTLMLLAIEHTNMLRPCFGMPIKGASQRVQHWVLAITFCCCIPIGHAILF